MEAAGDEHGFRGAWPPRALLELCLPQPPAPFSSRKAKAGRPSMPGLLLCCGVSRADPSPPLAWRPAAEGDGAATFLREEAHERLQALLEGRLEPDTAGVEASGDCCSCC